MSIVEKIKKLNLDPKQYVVVGSGIMVMHGLKDSPDIDLVVSPVLFESKKQEGWKIMQYTYPDKKGKIYLRKEDVELYTDVNCGNFNPSLPELLEKAETFDGVPFICLNDLLKFKKEYNRPKDYKDIQLIENFLEKTKE